MKLGSDLPLLNVNAPMLALRRQLESDPACKVKRRRPVTDPQDRVTGWRRGPTAARRTALGSMRGPVFILPINLHGGVGV